MDVTAAERREELEATIRLAVTRNGKCTATGKCAGCESNLADALAAADKYAQACADDAWNAAIGQQRLAAARAEHSPATMPGARS